MPSLIADAAARANPALFGRMLYPERSLPRHLLYLGSVLRDEIAAGIETNNGAIVLVMMPPGHAKSETCSVMTPLWFLDLWPERKVALVSYGHEKALEWGRRVRNEITSNPDKLFIRLAGDSKAANRWNTPQGGGMLCTGIGGALTGFRADLLVTDDPLKDHEEARSALMRERCWNWFRSVATTRLWPWSVELVVMTRWHEEDLAGMILAWDEENRREGRAARPVRVVRFPCIAEEDDELGRKPGEALWPEIGYDEQWAAAAETGQGPHFWASLYQQRPSPMGGAVFQRDHFRYFAYAPDHKFVLRSPGVDEPYVVRMDQCWCAQVTDTAMTEKALSDWTVVLTYGITPRGDMLVLDVARKRLEVPDQWDYVMAQRAKWRGGQVRWRWIGCENKMSGIGLLQLAKRRRVPMRELDAVQDKGTRASDAATLYQRGIVWHLRDAAWVGPYEKELCEFPYGAHDDQVDVIAYAARSYDEKGVIDVSGPRDYGPSEYDDPDRLQGGSFDVIGESPEW